MTNSLVAQIRLDYPGPLIGFLGATSPSSGYNPAATFLTSSLLRKKMQKGRMFSGGVEGVGVDAYFGAITRCLTEKEKTGVEQDDRFFILIPIQPYNPPPAYHYLAQTIGKRGCQIVRAGESMYERRVVLAAVADIGIVFNGGHGTLHEAVVAMNNGVKIIAFEGSGGTADKLCQAEREGEWAQADVYTMQCWKIEITEPSSILVARTPEEAVEMALGEKR